MSTINPPKDTRETTVYNPQTRVFEVKPIATTNPPQTQETPQAPNLRPAADTLRPQMAEANSSQAANPTRFEPRLPSNETERIAFAVYERYFGPNWQQFLSNHLFIDLRTATPEDLANIQGPSGWVITMPEATTASNELKKNHTVIFKEAGAADWPLRTEIGESVWNVLENIAVTGKIPSSFENKPPAKLAELLGSGYTSDQIVRLCIQTLDSWNLAYKTKPGRYAGMNPNSVREYNDIPEWKSEGFSDAIALWLKIRNKTPLDNSEQSVLNEFNRQDTRLMNIASTAVDLLI
jgi:hypothetical protein